MGSRIETAWELPSNFKIIRTIETSWKLPSNFQVMILQSSYFVYLFFCLGGERGRGRCGNASSHSGWLCGSSGISHTFFCVCFPEQLFSL